MRPRSIGFRLSLAFLGVSALFLTSGIVTWAILQRVTENQMVIGNKAIPALQAVQGISELAASIVTESPLLTEAQTDAERSRRWMSITDQLRDISVQLQRLKGTLLPEMKLEPIEATIGAITDNLQHKNALVDRRLRWRDAIATRTQTAILAADNLTDLSETLVANESAASNAVIANLYDLISPGGSRRQAFDALDRLIEVDLFMLERMSELRLRSSQTSLLLGRVGTTTNLADLVKMQDTYLNHVKVISRRVASIVDPTRRDQGWRMLAVLTGLSDDREDRDPFLMRRQLLAAVDEIMALDIRNRDLSEKLGGLVGDLVTEVGRFANSEATNSLQSARAGLSTIFALFLTSLVISTLVLIFYVEGRIVRRISTLAGALRKLAGGSLAIDVVDKGRDEIGEIADAVRHLHADAIRKKELETERELTAIELRRHREELQQLVGERTHQLVETNRLLETEVQMHDEARLKAEQASQVKSRFLAAMGHEIRTPVSGMLGVLDMIAKSRLSEEQKQQVGLVSGAGRALLDILNSILDFSQMESSRLGLTERRFDPHDVIGEVVLLMKPEVLSKSLTLGLAFAENVPPGLLGDAGKLRQILFNLISNAVKFTEEGGVNVHIGMEDGEEAGIRLLLTVSDTGIGMLPEDIKRSFEPFVQLDAGISRQYGGIGLGLAICRNLVETMGGTIEAESAPGTGSRFRLSLPFRRARQATAVAPSPLPIELAAMFAGKRVLVVEDDRLNELVVTALLEDLQAEVVVVNDGGEAVRRIGQETFDYALMDVSLPVMDGLEATRRIRAQKRPGRHLPIIGMSAHVFPREVENHISVGMDAYIGKPISQAALVAAFQAIDRGDRDRIFLPDTDGQGRDDRSDEEVLVDQAALSADMAILGWSKIGELCDLFAQTVEPRLEACEQALARQDFSVIAREAHAAMGACHALHLTRLAAIAGQCEQAAEASDTAVCRSSLAGFRGVLQKTLVALRAILREAA
ncbi:MAG: response regulator [Rhodospirillaceae bacterium]|nr:MAG: response regulator [Rhodospirillaceae bacterium]